MNTECTSFNPVMIQHDAMYPVTVFMTLKGQNFSPRQVLEKKSDKTGRADRVLYLCILAP